MQEVQLKQMKYMAILISLLFTMLYSTNWAGCYELIKDNTKIWYKKSEITNDYIVTWIVKGRKAPVQMYGDKYSFNLCPSYNIIFNNEYNYFTKRNNGTLKYWFISPIADCVVSDIEATPWFDGETYNSLKIELKNAHNMIGTLLKLQRKYGKEYDVLLKTTVVNLDRWKDI